MTHCWNRMPNDLLATTRRATDVKRSRSMSSHRRNARFGDSPPTTARERPKILRACADGPPVQRLSGKHKERSGIGPPAIRAAGHSRMACCPDQGSQMPSCAEPAPDTSRRVSAPAPHRTTIIGATRRPPADCSRLAVPFPEPDRSRCHPTDGSERCGEDRASHL